MKSVNETLISEISKISKFSISVRKENDGMSALKPGYALLGRLMLSLMANTKKLLKSYLLLKNSLLG